MRNRLQQGLLFWLLAFTTSFAALSQETTSDIQGLVTDGKTAVAGATVVVTHQPTGSKYSTTTRKDGRFNLPNLRVGGPYTIVTSFVGFKTQTQENVFLTLGQEFKADVVLSQDATVLTEVVVAATRQDKVINSNRTGSQEVVNRTQIERLPTINRSLQDLPNWNQLPTASILAGAAASTTT